MYTGYWNERGNVSERCGGMTGLHASSSYCSRLKACAQNQYGRVQYGRGPAYEEAALPEPVEHAGRVDARLELRVEPRVEAAARTQPLVVVRAARERGGCLVNLHRVRVVEERGAAHPAPLRDAARHGARVVLDVVLLRAAHRAGREVGAARGEAAGHR